MGEPILSCHIGGIARQDTAGFFKMLFQISSLSRKTLNHDYSYEKYIKNEKRKQSFDLSKFSKCVT